MKLSVDAIIALHLSIKKFLLKISLFHCFRRRNLNDNIFYWKYLRTADGAGYEESEFQGGIIQSRTSRAKLLIA